MIIGCGRRERAGRIVWVPLSGGKGGRMRKILVVELLSILLEKIMRGTSCCSVATERETHQSICSGRIHVAGIRKRRAAVFLSSGGGGHGHRFGGIENVIIQDAVNVAIVRRLPGVWRKNM